MLLFGAGSAFEDNAATRPEHAATAIAMNKKCPKCAVELDPRATANPDVCPQCGLVFAKWASRVLGTERLPHEAAEVREPAPGWCSRLVERITYVEPRTDPFHFWGRVVAYTLFFIWGWYFILLDFRSNEIGHSFMHRVDLVFHEAGHVLFIPFGRFMSVLGGTLGQLLMPIIVGAALVLRNNDNFGGSVGLWWLGQSVMDCAPYIADARALKLMLLGGGTGEDRPGMHDWENILLDLNLIQHDTKIAAAADTLGTLLMLMSFAWGGYILVKQYQSLKDAN